MNAEESSKEVLAAANNLRWETGGNLHDALVRGEISDNVDKIKVCKNLLEVVDFVHSTGIVMGDVKPANFVMFRVQVIRVPEGKPLNPHTLQQFLTYTYAMRQSRY